MPPLEPIRDPDQLRALAEQPLLVLFKHSTRCPVSDSAHAEVRAFAAHHPDVPVRLLDVIASRELARAAAASLGVPHASPQVIVLREGRAVWDASHWHVTANRLTAAVRRAAAAGDADADAAEEAPSTPREPDRRA